MAHVKPEESDHSVWQGYTLPQQHQQHQQHQQQHHHQQAPVASHPPSFDPSFSSAPLNLAYHGRPQKGAYRSLDLPSTTTRPIPREGDGILTSSPPTLNSHHSYPSLKRAFNDDAPYGEAVHDFREDLQDAPKPTIQQDHRLLSFSRLPDKHTLLDAYGRVQQVDLSAQIHGMFFLSEMGTPGAGGTVQPELTCYRRNLFQISGSVTAPRGSLSMISERGERLPVMSLEVAVSAIESVDGHSIKLIVIPWKTPPPNSPEVGPGQEHEPAPIPLLPYEDGDPDIKGDFAVYPIACRRLQFRIATANNGRRRELQQHFVLHLDVIATLANGQKMNACETTTSPIVVRGRSPRNFQARKEIPLVGSSASRGLAPELHVVTTVASSRPVAAVDSKVLKPLGNLELPRGPFNFDASNLPPSPLQMRQHTYQNWNPSQHPSDHTTSGGTSNSYPPSNLGLGDYMHVSSNSDPNNLQTVGSMAPTSTMPAPLHSQPPHQIRPQYHYHQPPNNTTSPIQQLHSPLPSNPAVRFIDSNPRPTKSPRHMAPSELPSNAYNPQDYSNARFAPSYSAPPMEAPLQPSPLTQPPLQQREYFPTTTSMSMSMQAWTTASDVGALYGATTGAMLPAVSAAHYDLGNEHGYVKSEPTSLPQQNYTWNPV